MFKKWKFILPLLVTILAFINLISEKFTENLESEIESSKSEISQTIEASHNINFQLLMERFDIMELHNYEFYKLHDTELGKSYGLDSTTKQFETQILEARKGAILSYYALGDTNLDSIESAVDAIILNKQLIFFKDKFYSLRQNFPIKDNTLIQRSVFDRQYPTIERAEKKLSTLSFLENSFNVVIFLFSLVLAIFTYRDERSN